MTDGYLILNAVLWTGYLISALVISVRDLKSHLVRNLDVVITGTFILACLALISIATGSVGTIISGALVGFLFGLVYFVLQRFSRGQLGAGDVGLAVLLGMVVGSSNLALVLIGLAMPFALAAPFGIVLLLVRGKGSRFAFAPFILLSAVPTVLLGQLI